MHARFNLSPVKRAHACNISTQHLEHCCAQHVTRVWPPCSNMLQDVGWCWIKFENGQIFVVAFLNVARCWARLASSFTTYHNTIQQCCKRNVACVWPAPTQNLTTRSNNVARCCVEMLCAFGQAFIMSL